ncbi:MAG: DoxX family protein [Acidimicrobiales bacterium]
MVKLLQRGAAIAAAAPYIWLGYEAAKSPGARKELVAQAGLPAADLLIRINGAAMVVGGLALATGFRQRRAALGLIASMVPTTLVGHSFWQHDDPQTRVTNRIQFLKNLGLIGGLVALATLAPNQSSPSTTRRRLRRRG